MAGGAHPRRTAGFTRPGRGWNSERFCPRGYGAFHGTPLADRLRERGVESLLITGTVTQICVEETAREAFHHHFKTTLVTDAVSSYVPDLHTATLKNFAMKFGWVESSENLLKLLT